MPIYYKKEIVSGTVKEELNAGEGVSIQDGTVSVTTPVKGITQAEYDALSEEDKNSGLYIVTDANISLNDRGEVYSTEETRIGTWIDGKPLYRKVLTGVFPSVKSLTIDSGVANLGRLITAAGYIERDDVGQDTIPNSFWYVYHTSAGPIISIELGSQFYYSKTYAITIEYTKTTDMGVST